MKKVFLILLFLTYPLAPLLEGENLWAGTTTVYVTADSYVRDGTYGDTNYGTETTFNVKKPGTANNLRRSFLKFKLADYELINNVQLFLYVDFVQDATPDSLWIDVYECSDTTWTETGITWNNQPSLTDSITSFKIVNVDTATWVEINLRSQFHYKNNDYITLALDAKTSGIEQAVGFSSKETAYDAYLKVDTTIYLNTNFKLCVEERNYSGSGGIGQNAGWTHYFDYPQMDTVKTFLHDEDSGNNDSGESVINGHLQFMINCINAGTYNLFVYEYRKNVMIDSLQIDCDQNDQRLRLLAINRLTKNDTLLIAGFDETSVAYRGIYEYTYPDTVAYFKYASKYYSGIGFVPGTDTLYCVSETLDSLEVIDMGTWTRVGIYLLPDAGGNHFRGCTIIDTLIAIGNETEEAVYFLGLRGKQTQRIFHFGNYLHYNGNFQYGVWHIKERIKSRIN